MRTTAALLFLRVATSTTAFTPRSVYPLATHYSSTTSSLSMTSAKRVLVPIADDSEEIETTCITDTLVRFGAKVVVASVKPDGDLVCKMSRGVKVRSARFYSSWAWLNIYSQFSFRSFLRQNMKIT